MVAVSPACAQDGINNDALLIPDCNGNPAPHHWLGDGYCDDGDDVEDGGLDCAPNYSAPRMFPLHCLLRA